MIVDSYLIFYFCLYIYPPDSQKSAGGAIHRATNYPDLISKIPRYCCSLEILIKIRLFNLELLANITKQGKVPYSVFPKDTTE